MTRYDFTNHKPISICGTLIEQMAVLRNVSLVIKWLIKDKQTRPRDHLLRVPLYYVHPSWKFIRKNYVAFHVLKRSKAYFHHYYSAVVQRRVRIYFYLLVNRDLLMVKGERSGSTETIAVASD